MPENLRQRDSVTRNRRCGKAYWLAVGVLFAALMPACTLLSVGRFIKNEYAPAMGRADTKRLASLSTPELADLYGRLTDAQLRALMQMGTAPAPKGSVSQKAGSAPSGKLDAFSSSKSRAWMRVKSGGQKITFRLRRVRGNWRVEDLWIHQKQGHWSFRDVLGLYALALRLGEDFRAGHLDAERVEPSLHAALAPLAARMHAWGVFREKPDEEPDTGDAGESMRLVNLTFSEEGARVDVAWGKLEVSVRAVHRKEWKLAGVELRLPGRPVLSLEKLARVLGPALMRLGDMRFSPGPEAFSYERVAELFAAPLRERLDPVMAPLWRSLAPLLPELVRSSAKEGHAPEKKPANADAGKKAVLDAWLQKVGWAPAGDGLEIFLRIDERNAARLAFDARGCITDFRVTIDSQTITAFHVAGFAPFVRWWEAVAGGKWTDPVRWLHEGLKLLDETHAGIEKQLPGRFSLIPLRLAAPAVSKSSSFGGNPAARHLPPMKLKSLRMAPAQVDLVMQVWGHDFHWTWMFADGIARLSGVNLDGRQELLDFLHPLAPLWRLLEGLASGDAPMAESALGPQAQARLGAPLAELVRVQGDFLQRFLREAAAVLVLKIAAGTESGADSKRPGASGDAPAGGGLQNIRLDVAARELVLGEMRVRFGLRTDGAWGFELPEPSPVRARRGAADHLLAVPELWPVLVGLYLGLVQESPGKLAAFSSPDFNAKVWRRLGRTGLQKLLKKFEISLEAPRADRLFGGADSARSGASGGAPAGGGGVRITGTQLRMQGRWPFAKIFIDAGGKTVEVKFSWDSRRRMLVLDDVRITVKILGRDVRLSLKNDLNQLL